MLLKLHKRKSEEPSGFRKIILLSAWGFVLASTSFLFLWVGHFLDEMLGTSPKLMLGMLFLAIVGCFIELFDEAREIMKNR